MQATIGRSSWVGKGQLESWLVGPAGSASAEEFVLAVLHDIYGTETEIAHWLGKPRQELHGRSARDLLRTHRSNEVELLVVREWNSQAISIERH